MLLSGLFGSCAAIKLKPDQLSLFLYKLRLACNFHLNIDMNEKLKLIDKANYFDSAVLFNLKQLLVIHDGNCLLLKDKQYLVENIFNDL